MKAPKRAATVIAAALGAIGLALPATASAARGCSLPAYNPGAVVVVDAPSATAVDVVSWSDVSWADSA